MFQPGKRPSTVLIVSVYETVVLSRRETVACEEVSGGHDRIASVEQEAGNVMVTPRSRGSLA